MAFNKTASLPGSDTVYQLNPLCKKYTLRDYGFFETKAGNFQFEQPLDLLKRNKNGINIKVTVDKEIQGLKLSTTTANGLKAISVFNNPAVEKEMKQAIYLLEDMVERNVLAIVE